MNLKFHSYFAKSFQNGITKYRNNFRKSVKMTYILIHFSLANWTPKLGSSEFVAQVMVKGTVSGDLRLIFFKEKFPNFVIESFHHETDLVSVLILGRCPM